MKTRRDQHGTSYTIDAAETTKSPGGTTLPGMPELNIWWARSLKARADETLILKQENQSDRSDVIQLTLGQVYDLIYALNKSVERT